MRGRSYSPSPSPPPPHTHRSGGGGGGRRGYSSRRGSGRSPSLPPPPAPPPPHRDRRDRGYSRDRDLPTSLLAISYFYIVFLVVAAIPLIVFLGGRFNDRRRSPPRYSRSPRHSRSPPPRNRSRSHHYYSPPPKRREYSRSVSPEERRYSRERSYSPQKRERSYSRSPPPFNGSGSRNRSQSPAKDPPSRSRSPTPERESSRGASMFDAMVDAIYYCIEASNFNNIPIVVTETGWPSFGGRNELDATLENAETYNNNLIMRVLNDSGPPSRQKITINTYIYELFDEDKRVEPITEKNWGIYYTNESNVYPLRFSASNQITENSSTAVFCVAKDDADTDKLKGGLSWACGQGQANCVAIQAGKPCYFPNNLESHASYAYNDYFLKMHNAGGTCDFDGTATITTKDPSHGSCIYAVGSSNSSSDGRSSSSTAFGPVSPFGAATLNLQMSTLQYLIIDILYYCIFNTGGVFMT
ncbi:unnamed protein product [Lupinus luteus]|uniref:glucan endo-1,3-beta-D-glucosidase n=1 Tax=Lupinus luteus TaxID=3873 RepID=A0AAV1Y4M3_LUPLU